MLVALSPLTTKPICEDEFYNFVCLDVIISSVFYCLEEKIGQNARFTGGFQNMSFVKNFNFSICSNVLVKIAALKMVTVQI
jgi:hypothetical protein